jgi:superfamily II DNA/RNA helicase
VTAAPPTQGQIDHLMGLAKEAQDASSGFAQMALEPMLLGALKSLSFDTPTEIQKNAIPKALAGNDILGCAQTGTGKTLAFCVPILNRLLKDPKGKAIILVPTRELGLQIEEVLKGLMKKIDLGLPVLLIGGVSYVYQFRQLKQNYRVIIATPGRLIDHLAQETIDLSTVDGLVLDEADRMLDVGFKPQLNEILQYLPKERQTMMFTATLSTGVRSLVEKYLNKPMIVNSGETSKPNEKIQQKMIEVEFSKKNDTVMNLLKDNTGSALLFVKTQIKTEKISEALRDLGIDAEPIHGGLTQGQRKRAIESFRRQEVRVLVATDVASRGLDIDHVGLVINYDLPFVIEDYVHRIGRTGRAGREGVAVSLVSREDRRIWMMISRKYLSGQADLQLSGGSGGGGGGRGGGSRDYSPRGGRGYAGRGGGRDGGSGGGGSRKSWR